MTVTAALVKAALFATDHPGVLPEGTYEATAGSVLDTTVLVAA